MATNKTSTYVIGDIHGCYTQFIELLERIEKRDPRARFILVGDIVSRGPEDEKMLAWAYENITPDGKYQMTLGNHDDTFIEIFGKGEFVTIYSLSDYKPDKDVFWRLDEQKKLMYQYAKFLASLPLFKKLEINGQKYIIAHAWYSENPNPELYDDLDPDNPTFNKRFMALWYRDREDYNGEFEDDYEPIDGEILIHGHTPTLTNKEQMHREFSPGKIWKRENSINVDCGLVFNVAKYGYSYAKFGNLAAYHLETGEAEYLWEIVDEYALNDDEYYEDRIKREQKEHEERKIRAAIEEEEWERKADAAWAKFNDPYLQSFFKQILDLDKVPARKDYNYDARFNFLQHHLRGITVFNKGQSDEDHDFDFEKTPLIAVADIVKDGKCTQTFYAYNDERSSGFWIDVPLEEDWFYQAFRHKGENYLLGVNDYDRQYGEGVVYYLGYFGAVPLVKYGTYTPKFNWHSKEEIFAANEKFNERGKLTGLMTWDFCNNHDELLTIKAARNYGSCYHVHIVNSKGEVIAEISRAYTGI